MPFRPDEIEDRLRHKFGFSDAPGHELNHTWLVLAIPGTPRLVKTKIEHHRGVIGNPIEGRIAKQLRVRAPFFREMIACTKSREDYQRQVQSNPFPPWEQWTV